MRVGKACKLRCGQRTTGRQSVVVGTTRPVVGMEDVEKAIVLTFDQSSAVNAGLRNQATAYLQQLKQSPDAWQYFVAGFEGSSIAEVRFWFVQVGGAQVGRHHLRHGTRPHTTQALHDAIQHRYQDLDVPCIRTALLSWYKQGPALPPYLRNKVAQALAGVAGREYPSGWPTMVPDVLPSLIPDEGLPGRSDMLCRLLRALDDDVIAVDVPRSQEESRRSMRVKVVQ